MADLEGLVEGSYGYTILITLLDQNGAVQNISAYTTISVILRSEDERKRVTCSGSFATDGTDGKIIFQTAAADLDREGTWRGQVSLSNVSSQVLSYPFTIDVGEAV